MESSNNVPDFDIREIAKSVLRKLNSNSDKNIETVCELIDKETTYGPVKHLATPYKETHLCYHNTTKYVLFQAHDATVVHGLLISPTGLPVSHAWIESYGKPYDITSPSTYGWIYVPIKRYTYKELYENVMKFQHSGPFEKICEYGLGLN